jgi:hypothetical protein
VISCACFLFSNDAAAFCIVPDFNNGSIGYITNARRQNFGYYIHLQASQPLLMTKGTISLGAGASLAILNFSSSYLLTLCSGDLIAHVSLDFEDTLTAIVFETSIAIQAGTTQKHRDRQFERKNMKADRDKYEEKANVDVLQTAKLIYIPQTTTQGNIKTRQAKWMCFENRVSTKERVQRAGQKQVCSSTHRKSWGPLGWILLAYPRFRRVLGFINVQSFNGCSGKYITELGRQRLERAFVL